MEFFDYSAHAETYNKLEIADTYYLAFRDIPRIVRERLKGVQTLDYGCGSGRSTRFLKDLGLAAIGADISDSMVQQAKKNDPDGEYHTIKSGELPLLEDESLDLVFNGFVFDSVASKTTMMKICRETRRVLKDSGIMIVITSTPELYTVDTASFKCDFPENHAAQSGDKVKCIIRGNPEIEVWDYQWKREDYREVFEVTGLEVVEAIEAKADGNEPLEWVSEKQVAPWTVYVLKKSARTSHNTG